MIRRGCGERDSDSNVSFLACLLVRVLSGGMKGGGAAARTEAKFERRAAEGYDKNLSSARYSHHEDDTIKRPTFTKPRNMDRGKMMGLLY
jgi:hypothetical protein